MAKNSRKHRKGRKGRKSRSHRRSHRRYYGGAAYAVEPASVDYANPGPMNLNLAQGQQFAKFHVNQHGGVFSGGPYPGAVTEPSMLPANLVASAHLLPLNQAFSEIRGLSDQTGGRRRRRNGRKSRKNSKNRKGCRKNRSRRYRGGDFVRWGGGGMYGMPEMLPSSVADSTKMLISPQLQQQAGLNPEWKLAENPSSFDPLPQPRA